MAKKATVSVRRDVTHILSKVCDRWADLWPFYGL